MKFAVTAVSGQLGREIALALIEAKGREQVIGLARTPENAKGLDIDVRPGDYDRPEELEESLRGVDAVLLVSGMAPPDERIGQHRNVIEAAKAAGVGKIVYTSIQGAESGTAFSPIVASNRQTEADIRASGLTWAIGRNGIYIEPDIDYIDTYRARGEIANSAGNGRCGYTTRPELAYAALHTILYLIDEGAAAFTVGELTRFYIWTGWLAFLIFVPLAITSTDRWVRKLGPGWKTLQRSVYAVAVLTLLHWAALHDWGGVAPAVVHFGPLGLLQAYRIWRTLTRRRTRAEQIPADRRTA